MRWILLIVVMFSSAMTCAGQLPSAFSNPRISPNPGPAGAPETFTVQIEANWLETQTAVIARNGNVVTITQTMCFACTSPAVNAHDAIYALGDFLPGQYTAHLVGINARDGTPVLPILDTPFAVLGATTVASAPTLDGTSLVLLIASIAITALLARLSQNFIFSQL